LRTNLKTVRAYLVRKDFQQVWEYRSSVWAGKFLDQWCQRGMRSRIELKKKMARPLRKHKELLLNWFHAKGEISSGTVGDDHRIGSHRAAPGAACRSSKRGSSITVHGLQARVANKNPMRKRGRLGEEVVAA
jgi:hypothetical protein